MFEQTTAIKAARQLDGVVQQIKDEQWQMTMPPEFPQADSADTTLYEIINYHSYDDAWIPDMLDGKTMQEVGEDNYKGDLLGNDPKATFREYMDRACIAIDKLDDPQRTVHCSFGDFTAQQFLWQVCCFRGLRSYHVAKAIGANPDLPDDLVEALWKIITPHAEEWRAIGVFGPEVPVPENARLQDRLLGLTGSQP